MSEANDTINPDESNPLPDELKDKTPEEILAFAVASIPQYKGLQRANERLRTDQRSGIRQESLEKKIDLNNQSVTALIEVVGNLSLNDEATLAKLSAITEETTRVQTALSSETTVREEIVDTLGKYGLDYDDDSPQAEVLRTHYEAGDFDAVRSDLNKINEEHTTTDIETRAKAIAEETLRERGITVNTEQSAGGSPPSTKDKILKDLESGDLTDNQALAAAVELANAK